MSDKTGAIWLVANRTRNAIEAPLNAALRRARDFRYPAVGMVEHGESVRIVLQRAVHQSLARFWAPRLEAKPIRRR